MGREPGSKRHLGLSWVICNMKSPGIAVRPIENLAGASHFSQVFYDNVRIPISDVGLEFPIHLSHHERAIVSGIASGAAEIQLNLVAQNFTPPRSNAVGGRSPGSSRSLTAW
jgi:alkylation response protein AidB-like acyl-CoA dehydrogenase